MTKQDSIAQALAAYQKRLYSVRGYDIETSFWKEIHDYTEQLLDQVKDKQFSELNEQLLAQRTQLETSLSRLKLGLMKARLEELKETEGDEALFSDLYLRILNRQTNKAVLAIEKGEYGNTDPNWYAHWEMKLYIKKLNDHTESLIQSLENQKEIVYIDEDDFQTMFETGTAMITKLSTRYEKICGMVEKVKTAADKQEPMRLSGNSKKTLQEQLEILQGRCHEGQKDLIDAVHYKLTAHVSKMLEEAIFSYDASKALKYQEQTDNFFQEIDMAPSRKLCENMEDFLSTWNNKDDVGFNNNRRTNIRTKLETNLSECYIKSFDDLMTSLTENGPAFAAEVCTDEKRVNLWALIPSAAERSEELADFCQNIMG